MLEDRPDASAGPGACQPTPDGIRAESRAKRAGLPPGALTLRSADVLYLLRVIPFHPCPCP